MINLLMYWIVHHTDLLLCRNIPWSEASCLCGCDSMGGLPPQLFLDVSATSLLAWLFSSFGIWSQAPCKILQTCLHCTCICAWHSLCDFHMHVFTVKMPSQSHHCHGYLIQIWGNNHKQPPKSCKLLSCTAPAYQIMSRTNYQMVFFFKRSVLVSLFNLTQF